MKTRTEILIPSDPKDVMRLIIALEDHLREHATAINLNDDKLRQGSSANKPSAAEALRGVIYITEAASGVADTVDVCLKSAGDTYSWVNIA